MLFAPLAMLTAMLGGAWATRCQMAGRARYSYLLALMLGFLLVYISAMVAMVFLANNGV